MSLESGWVSAGNQPELAKKLVAMGEGCTTTTSMPLLLTSAALQPKQPDKAERHSMCRQGPNRLVAKKVMKLLVLG